MIFCRLFDKFRKFSFIREEVFFPKSYSLRHYRLGFDVSTHSELRCVSQAFHFMACLIITDENYFLAAEESHFAIIYRF